MINVFLNSFPFCIIDFQIWWWGHW